MLQYELRLNIFHIFSVFDLKPSPTKSEEKTMSVLSIRNVITLVVLVESLLCGTLAQSIPGWMVGDQTMHCYHLNQTELLTNPVGVTLEFVEGAGVPSEMTSGVSYNVSYKMSLDVAAFRFCVALLLRGLRTVRTSTPSSRFGRSWIVASPTSIRRSHSSSRKWHVQLGSPYRRV